MISRLRSWIHAVVHRRSFEDGLDEEMRFHLEQYTDDLVGAGVPRPEAARRARVEFGNLHNVRLDCRDARGAGVVDLASANVRWAFRRLRRTPVFTASVIATLALALGSTLTIGAVVDAVLLRPLPFPAAGDLVSVYNTYPKAGVPDDGCSLTNYYERRGRIAAFAGVAAYREGTAVLGPAGATEREAVTRVSPDFFATLGLEPVPGRAFRDDETSYQNSRVAILTDGYWADRLNRDPDVIGRAVRVDGADRIVVGVLPPGFRFLSSKARIYLPLASEAGERDVSRRHSGNSRMIARLKPGIGIVAAQSEIDAHNASLESTNPDAPKMAAAGFRSMVVPLHGDHVQAVRSILLLLQAGVFVLLAIAGVNVTNLFLIRASGRAHELAVRQAIGASRRHVVLEVMAETLAVALAGGALGVPIGAWGISLLRVLGADHLPLGARIAFDVRLALAGVAGAVALGAAIAVPVAWYHLAVYRGRLCPSGSRVTSTRQAQRLRHGFVVVQIALAFVLVAGAGLLAVSLQRVMAVLPGFRPDNVLTGQMTLPARSYPGGAELAAFTERLLTIVERQPGVSAAGFATNIPLSGISNKSAATVKGYALGPGEWPHGHYSYSVGGDYFAALGYSLREGRFLRTGDARAGERVCVVDDAFAQRHWPDGDAIGRLVFEGPSQRPDAEGFRVVGVVGAAKQAGLVDEDALGAVYYPFVHRMDRNIFVVARTSLEPGLEGRVLRDAVRSIDAELPVSDIRSMQSRIGESLVSRRSPAFAAAVFSGMALLLAAIGTYGVLAHAVQVRRREIALRIALGARPAQVRGQFVRLALRLLAAASLLGVAGAWLAGRMMQAILFQVPALHLPTLVATAAIIALVAFVACVRPAHHAAQISPVDALAE